MDERRRFPRRQIHGEYAGVQATVSVQVLDISLSGVLLHSSHPIRVGDRGFLRLSLGGEPFTAEVEVQRVSAGPGNGYRIGLAFVGVGAEQGQLIERFVAQ
jgi:hypothetical protein